MVDEAHDLYGQEHLHPLEDVSPISETGKKVHSALFDILHDELTKNMNILTRQQIIRIARKLSVGVQLAEQRVSANVQYADKFGQKPHEAPQSYLDQLGEVNSLAPERAAELVEMVYKGNRGQIISESAASFVSNLEPSVVTYFTAKLIEKLTGSSSVQARSDGVVMNIPGDRTITSPAFPIETTIQGVDLLFHGDRTEIRGPNAIPRGIPTVMFKKEALVDMATHAWKPDAARMTNTQNLYRKL